MHVLDRFHASLALESLGVGLAVTLVWAAIRRGRASGGVVTFATATAASLLIARHYVFPIPVVIGMAVVLLGGAAVRRLDASTVGVLAVVSLTGVWLAVPDTEVPLIAVGVVAAPALWASRRSTPFAVVDRLAAIGLVVLAAWVGSAGRSEVVGGIGCVGLLAVPLSRSDETPQWVGTVAVHAVAVAVSSRLVTRLPVEAAVPAVVLLLVVASGISARARR